MNEIRITEIQIIPIKPKDGLVAFASVVINNSVYLGSIGVHCRHDGTYRIVYPSKRVADKELNIYHPINRIASKLIEAAITEKCASIFEKSDASNDRHYQVINKIDGQTA